MNRNERIAALQEKLDPTGDRTERIWAKNDFVDFPVFKAPTDLLALNPSNRRFRAEAQEVEGELGHGLDPLSSAEDEESVVSLLLARDPHVDGSKVVGKLSKDTEALILDWEKRHQERPLWIRPDGLVSNGNRRLAMLKHLQRERGKEGYDWVDVIVLDEDAYDDETLFEMEAREQLTEGLKVRYSKINALLTLKDAAEKLDIDWHDQDSLDETAKKIQDLVGNNPNYAKVQLQAVKYMTDYLEWLGKPGEYPLLRRQVERFRDIGKNMAWVAKEDPTHEADMLEVCFQAVRVGAKHPDLREIRLMLKNEQEAFTTLVDEVHSIEDEETVEEEDEKVVAPIVDEEAEDGEDEGDDEDEADVGPLTPREARLRSAIKVAVKGSRDSRDSNRLENVRLAATRLTEVNPDELVRDVSGVERGLLLEAISEIIKWAGAAQEAVRKPAASD